MSWTDERVERLKTLWSEGLSASQIAAELGAVTRNAVIGKVHRLGLSGRAKPQVQPSRPTAAPATGQRVKAAPARAAVQSQPSGRVTQATARPVSIGATALKADSMAEEALLPARVTEIEPPTFERVTILNLTESTCKWPVGDPGKPDFFFCGRKSDVGIPYCAFHARIAYQPSTERRRERDRRAAG
ncbi:GcrA family cell cycle regulator [Oryzibacter oryziterrae]|uniref:GcrA family cell cycle regulator n=1 Tax=Oryzibacter oryziterrae TaxID=2766474 RepID=UPI001F291A94|nr:GcrA family cell cycle regulator [Oryzibacter oryziterrae]